MPETRTYTVYKFDELTETEQDFIKRLKRVLDRSHGTLCRDYKEKGIKEVVAYKESRRDLADIAVQYFQCHSHG